MKKRLLWAGLAVASVAAITALSFSPDVFGGLDQRATLDRTQALAAARAQAQRLDLGPDPASEALVYANDDSAQAFVELKGGGLPVLNQAAQEGLYTPSRWTVRRFREGEVFEASFFFAPSGTFLGWNERHSENESLPNLAEADARQLAVDRALSSGVIDLSGWTLTEASSVTQHEGRVDWTFTWERVPSPFGEGKLRWTAVVSGDQVTRLEPNLKVPDTFQRWYENERSINGAIGTLSAVGMAVLFLLAGAAALRLGRNKQVAWKRAWVVGAVLGLGATMPLVNGLSQMWVSYDTALPGGVFLGTQIGIAVLGAGLMTLFYGFTLAGADALYRRAFPAQLSLGTPGGLRSVGRSALSGRVAGGLLAVPLWLLAVTGFYAFTKGNWGWWTPASGLSDPNIVGQFLPWLSPVGNAVQAAVWEEFFFRGLPLALAAWAGTKWGHRRWWLGAALVGQAVVFAAAHASYPGLPGWSRLVELLVPALVLGLVVLRWGLLPAILLHFGYDFVLMSQPLFTTDSASLIPDRIAVILVALALPAAAVWNHFWRKDRPEVEPPVTAASDPTTPPPPEPVHEPVETPLVAGPAVSPRWPWLVALAAAGLVGAIVAWQPPEATLKVDRAEAQAAALRALAAEGFVPGPTWTLDVTSTSQPGDDDRYLRTTAGKAEVQRARALGYLAPPRWVFQWSDYASDVQSRERWWVEVSSDDHVDRVVRVLPEGKAGAKLTRDEAVDRAVKALAPRLGLAADQAVVKAAVETSLPNRTDWALSFDVPGVSTEAWAAHAQVVVAGDEVTDARKLVFLPEEWTRTWQEQSSVGGLVSLVAGLAVWSLVGWGVFRGFRAWSRKQFQLSAFWAVTAAMAGAFSVTCANTWSTQAQGFSLAQPYLVQSLTLVLLVPILFVVMGLAWGLMAGALARPEVRWTLPPLSRFVPGLLVAVGCYGLSDAIAWVAPLGTTYVADVSAASASIPWLASGVLSWAAMFIILPGLVLWDRAAAWSAAGKSALAALLVFGMGACYHFGLTVDTWQNALVRMSLSGVLALGAWWLIRHDSLSLLVALSATTGLGFVASALLAPYPGSWIGSLVGLVALAGATLVFSGWEWSRPVQSVPRSNRTATPK